MSFSRFLSVPTMVLLGILTACQDPQSSSSGAGPARTGAVANHPDAVTAAATANPAPPVDAQYTIHCQDYLGASHAEVAAGVKKVLLDSTDLKGWYVVNATDKSMLYYGFYKTIDTKDLTDPEEARRAINDLNAVRSLRDSNGAQLFGTALPVAVDQPDPEADTKWDLTKSHAYWTVEIGTYTAQGRKQAAVDSVRAARAQGIEAYYYHGQNASSVCIGAWPESAAHEIKPEDVQTDPDAVVLVTPQPVSPRYARQLGANVQNVAPHVEIVDPTLSAALHDQRWPEHDVNGQGIKITVTDPETGQAKEQIQPPLLVKVPQPDVTASSPQDTAAPTAPAPTTELPGMGKLRGLGE